MIVRGPRVVAAELALAAVSLSVVVGFGRLFLGTSWRAPLLLVAVLVHATSALVRRLGVGVLGQLASAAVGVTLLVGWTLAPETLRFLLPTAETWTTLGAAIDEAVSAYPTARAPVEATDGFVLASMIGVAIVAAMANVAAFTLRAPLQALIPPFTLFVLGALLGSGEHRVGTAVAFVVTSLGFVLAVRGLEITSSTTWLPGERNRGPDAHMRVGGALIGVCAVVAMVVGPALPGATEDAMWTWRGGGGGGGDRTIISPLVDIQRRLVNQSRSVAFVVDAPTPSYWRMMSLDAFDGQQWTMSASMREVSGSLAVGPVADGEVVRQRVEVRSLGSEYLPAAFSPVAIDAGDATVTWDDRSATLLLDRPIPSGFRYEVDSLLPDVTPDQLRAVSGPVAPAVAQRYLQLPALDPRVAELAESVTAGADTHYDRALALQTFFRDEFGYSLEVPDGSGTDSITRFLFEDRQGYCEQFAASFAAMARTLGMPSRVAVGFTEGDRSGPSTYTVRGADAHAWPEIYFSGAGWVPFEPTPGRTAPGSSAWTGLTEDGPGSEDPSTTPTSEPEVASPPTIPPELQDQIFPPGMELDGPTGSLTEPSDPLVPTWARAPLLVVGAVAAWFALVSAGAGLRHRQRRRRAGDDRAARVALAWSELVELLTWRGRAPHRNETYLEYARRVGQSAPATAVDLGRLADLATTARFARSTDDAAAEEAEALGTRLRRTVVERLPSWRRVLRAGDLRRLWAGATLRSGYSSSPRNRSRIRWLVEPK